MFSLQYTPYHSTRLFVSKAVSVQMYRDLAAMSIWKGCDKSDSDWFSFEFDTNLTSTIRDLLILEGMEESTFYPLIRKEVTMEEKEVCEYCGREETKGNRVFMRPDPFDLEIYDDDTEYMMCDECEKERAMDI